MPVIIAAHPKSDPLFTNTIFEGRTAIQGESARLTRDASLVFANNTAGLTFAILWRKPIVLLTTDELRKSYLNTYIEAYRDELSVPMFNVDDYRPADINLEAWKQMVSASYEAFQDNHIKTLGSPNRPLWEIVADAVSASAAQMQP
jgi:hypothetical protein